MVLINLMSAYYDTYNYPSYWDKREYEHESEIIALKSLLLNIKKIDSILDIGAGYGRLTQTYLYRGKKVILIDPSLKLLSIAKNTFKDNKKIKYIQSQAETLKGKIRPKSVDLAIMIRVIHHLANPEKVFKIVNKLIKPGGYLILEFANKSHGKAVFKEMCKGNLTFLLDIFPKDMRSSKSKRKKTIPFKNYHPDSITKMLTDNGFKIIDKRSVSNIRSTKIKNSIALRNLLKIEQLLQKPLSYLNFGPSIFILARKKGN
ncbi:methyltransferase domain-containing protein [Patescibacteria group bacterium]|nr:methyltransferase domain-containing protein [Patescibacteria group bacterium]